MIIQSALSHLKKRRWLNGDQNVNSPSKHSKLKLFFLTATAKFHLLQIVNYRYFIDLKTTFGNSILERIYQWETIAFVVAL